MKSKYGFDTTRSRSELMKKIKAKDTKPELLLRKELWRLGYRYRKHSNKLPGKPDIVFNKYKLVIFVDGEFWHGYNWEDKKRRIKVNKEYWIKKIERNIERDMNNTEVLISMGYTVLRFWEHQINKKLYNCIDEITGNLPKVAEITTHPRFPLNNTS